MLATVLPLSLTSCLDTANTLADAALEAIENYEEAESADTASDDTVKVPETEPEPETVRETEPETEKETAPETVKETEPETKAPETKAPETEAETEPEPAIDEDGWYDDKENVALYIHTYGKLPPNYVSKNDAEDLYGWTGGALDQYEKGMAIGGSKFGNYEGLLPKKSGRQYYECDIDTVGTSSRGAKRIVYSNDGLIYYTDDHYESFELLYGEE
ncbi:MAG: ribonuclease [Clostridia bacterium]|nr:ribonuclease [Clostridia bacterium]MBQ8370865.1 ribonuclease [Clostridia bacterium]